MSELHVVFGTGPLGRYTAEALLTKGKQVRLVSRSGRMESPPAGAEVLKADALDPAQTSALLAGAVAVYQCSQPAYHRWAEEFPALQQAIVDAAARVGAKLLVAENLYGYGDTHGKPMTEDLPLQPCSRKGEVRAAMTRDLFSAHAAGKVRVSAVRGSDFWGPYDLVNADRTFQAAIDRKPVNMLGRLDQLHTFTYVKDFGQALAIAGTDDRALGRAWHVPSGAPLTQGQLLEALGKVLGYPVRGAAAGKGLLSLIGLFSPSVKEVVEMLYEFTGPFVLDATAFETTFGLAATPLDVRLAETVAWVRSRKAAK